jgi:hypothetical protein
MYQSAFSGKERWHSPLYSHAGKETVNLSFLRDIAEYFQWGWGDKVYFILMQETEL